MKKWNIYQKDSGEIEAVKEGFNWWAFFFVGLWALYKGLIWAAIIALLLTISANQMPADADIIIAPIMVALMLIYGFMGNSWVAAKLENRGYSHSKQIEAASAEGAKTKFHEVLAVKDKKSHFETAWREIEQEQTNMNIWAEAYAICEGDEAKTKAKYIELRVADLLEIQKDEREKESLSAIDSIIIELKKKKYYASRNQNGSWKIYGPGDDVSTLSNDKLFYEYARELLTNATQNKNANQDNPEEAERIDHERYDADMGYVFAIAVILIITIVLFRIFG